MTLHLAGALHWLTVVLQNTFLVPGKLLLRGWLAALLRVEAFGQLILLGLLQHFGPQPCPLILCHLLLN